MIKINALDILFSDYIRTRDGWTCQRCITLGRKNVFRPNKRLIDKLPQFEHHVKSGMGLHNMHCYSRGGKTVRYEPDNCCAGCYGCHSYLDTHPLKKYAFFKARLGSKKYNRIVKLSKTNAVGKYKFDREAVKKRIKNDLSELLSKAE